ncbi:MAG: hypothetical protein Q8940_18925 [Bacteroidota bacterium]|nr:hypothetical protein [Bacteroidota bacterium]
MNDIYIFSDANLLEQLNSGKYELGFYRVKFYTINGMPASEKTDTIGEFFLYPSGGTLRDSDMNIVFYSPKFDTYKGFIPPGKQ